MSRHTGKRACISNTVALSDQPLGLWTAQGEAEKKLAELGGSLASLVSDAAAAKTAAEAELRRALSAADAKIQAYNERTNEVCLNAVDVNLTV